MKILLLDTNVLVDYYLQQSSIVVKNIQFLFKKKREKLCVLFISNFCIGEVFSTFAKNCFYEKRNRISEDAFISAKKQFLYDLTRDSEFKRYQYFNTLELNRYHLLIAHLVYQPAWQFQYEKHIVSRDPEYFKIDKKTGKRYPPKLCSVDQLTIAQGIELTSLYPENDVAVVTSDKLMLRLGKHLQNDITDEQKNEYVKFPGITKQQDQNNDNGHLADFKYPNVIDAANESSIRDFFNNIK